MRWRCAVIESTPLRGRVEHGHESDAPAREGASGLCCRGASPWVCCWRRWVHRPTPGGWRRTAATTTGRAAPVIATGRARAGPAARANTGKGGVGDGGQPGGEAAPGAARTPADAANPPPVRTPPAPAEWIRIATWNLNRLHWRTGGALWRGAAARSDEDYRTLARYARALNADVIAFQEVNGPRAAARVFPPRDYSLHFSGRYDSRYDDIYNGFAVRKGRFDQIVKRDHEALGLDSNARYQLRWGVDLMVSREDEGFGCSTSISSRSVSARVWRTPAAGTAASSPGRSRPSKHGSTPAGARGCRSWCWAISTAPWTGTGRAITCGAPSTTVTRRGWGCTGCRRVATRPAGAGRHAITAIRSTSSCSARTPGSGWTRGPSGRSSGPMRTRTRAAGCPPTTAPSPSISSDPGIPVRIASRTERCRSNACVAGSAAVGRLVAAGIGVEHKARCAGGAGSPLMVCEGESRDGQPHGQGVATFPDGERYEGGFRKGDQRPVSRRYRPRVRCRADSALYASILTIAKVKPAFATTIPIGHLEHIGLELRDSGCEIRLRCELRADRIADHRNRGFGLVFVEAGFAKALRGGVGVEGGAHGVFLPECVPSRRCGL